MTHTSEPDFKRVASFLINIEHATHTDNFYGHAQDRAHVNTRIRPQLGNVYKSRLIFIHMSIRMSIRMSDDDES